VTRALLRRRGFTLIEVLVALAIVTLGMAALLGTLNSAAGTAGYLQDKTLAEWIALNQVSKVRLSAQAPSKGDSEGEIDYAGRKWKWTQNIDDGSIPGVLFIVVKVRPSDVAASGDNAWYADVTGVIGDAVGAPRGDLPSWNITPGQPSSGAGGTQPATQQGAPPGTPNGPGAGTPPVFNPQVSPPTSGPAPTQH
jgi:general secretion pathway protein I